MTCVVHRWRLSLLGRVIVLAAIAILLGSPGRLAAAARAYSPEIAAYVRFLEGQRQSNVDYVLGLFASHDLVILCERDHRETTQYDFVHQLIARPEFARDVGHIFMEVGSRSQEQAIDDFVTAQGLTDRAVDQRIVAIYRNLTWFPLWEKTNYGQFLRGVHALNQGLRRAQMIHVHPVDLSFDWASGTRASYAEFEAKLVPDRDRFMADVVLEGLGRLARSDPTRQKALVIMNFRHAFNDRFLARGQPMNNTGRFLFEALPGRVANVLLSTLAPLPDSDDHHVSEVVVQKGKWDAAFGVLDDPGLGFNLAGSPFGRDVFDLFPWVSTTQVYDEVFTGFVFHRPLRDHRVSWGIPGVFDEAFQREFRRRLAITGQDVSEEDVARFAQERNVVHESPYEDLARHEQAIRAWVRPVSRANVLPSNTRSSAGSPLTTASGILNSYGVPVPGATDSRVRRAVDRCIDEWLASRHPPAGFSFDRWGRLVGGNATTNVAAVRGVGIDGYRDVYDFWLRNGDLAKTIDILKREASQGPGIPAPGNGD